MQVLPAVEPPIRRNQNGRIVPTGGLFYFKNSAIRITINAKPWKAIRAFISLAE